MAEVGSEVYFRVAFISLLLSLASGDCIDLDLGMENGTILDSKITASSVKSASTPAKNGRLNYTLGSSWCAGTSDSNPYLQIDLQTLHIVCAVSTQGNSQADQWVKTYTLKLSKDGSSWTDYEENGLVKTLEGNNDRKLEMKHVVYGVLTRYLQFVPKTHLGGVCMRTEVFGVKTKPENLAHGKSTAQSSIYNYNSTVTGVSRNAVDGNADTDFQNGHCSHTNATNPSWWRVDLGTNLVPVSEIFIVNRFSSLSSLQQRNIDYKITLGMVEYGQSSANPKCGDTYTYPFPVGEGRSFFCHPSLKGSYVIIRFVNRNDPLTLCEVEVYSERRACPMQAIGVASSDAFPDNSFSASSTSGSNKAFKGRLNGDGAWLPSNNNNANDYLQIDLGYEFVICAVATQGNPSADHWTTKYKLQLALIDLANNWLTYQENSIDKEFNGNSGKNDIVKHRLKEYASARFIRFQPTNYKNNKALRVEVFGILISTVPSQAPSGFTVAASSSTSITASWQLPPKNARHGIITGFKLFYVKKASAESPTMLTYNDTSLNGLVGELDKYTEYEFQVLAFSSEGDGPKSSVVVARTKEDAPSMPTSLTYTLKDQDKSHGPRINLTWSIPAKPNGVIRNYTVFYSYNGNPQREISGIDALSYSVDVLGGATYEFHVRAVTIKPGPNATLTVNVPEYAPSHGPENVSSTGVNYTTFEVTWAALSKKVAHGIIKMYQVRLFVMETCTLIQSELYSRFNTTTTNLVLSGLSICGKYEVSIRGYTAVGPGPYSRAIILQTLGVKWSKNTPSSPSFPWNLTKAGFTAKITLPRLPTNARFFQVIIITVSAHYSGLVDSPESFTPQDLETYEEAHESLVPAAYVTFQFSGNDFDNYQEFIVGNGAKSNSKTRSKRSCDDNEQYYNKPLQPNTNYRVFLRAFVTEMLYISSNFIEIKTKEKPAVKKLPEKSILSVGELVLLTCEVTGDPAPFVTWTKNGNTSIPRAQFKNDDRILVIKDVRPLDSGVYECKATNTFGESRTSTTLIVAVPPTIAKEVSPSSVTCEMQTLCSFSCHATSGSPFNYSWTKNGQVPDSDDIKIMNNIIVLMPRDAEDYGVYVCHATNSFGSTTYRITVSLTACGNIATVITLSCIVFILLAVIGVLIWRLRRALPENRATTANQSITDNVGQRVSPRDQQMPEPDCYMELLPRPLEGQSPGPPAGYQSLQRKDKNNDYYNVGFNNRKYEQEEIYHEVRNAQC